MKKQIMRKTSVIAMLAFTVAFASGCESQNPIQVKTEFGPTGAVVVHMDRERQRWVAALHVPVVGGFVGEFLNGVGCSEFIGLACGLR